MNADRPSNLQVIAELWGDGAWVTTVVAEDGVARDRGWTPAALPGGPLPDLLDRVDDAVPALVGGELVPVTELVARFLASVVRQEAGSDPASPVAQSLSIIHPDAMSAAAQREITRGLTAANAAAGVHWVSRGSVLAQGCATTSAAPDEDGPDGLTAVLAIDESSLEVSIWSVSNPASLVTRRARGAHPGRVLDDAIREGLRHTPSRARAGSPAVIQRAHATQARTALAIEPATEIAVEGERVRVLRTEVRDWVQGAVTDQLDVLASVLATLPAGASVDRLVIVGPYAYLPGLVELSSDRFGVPVTAHDRVLDGNTVPLMVLPSEAPADDQAAVELSTVPGRARRRATRGRRRAPVRNLLHGAPRAAAVAAVAVLALSGLAVASPDTSDAVFSGPRNLAQRLLSGAVGDVIPEQALPMLLPPVVAGAGIFSGEVVDLVRGNPDRRDLEAGGARSDNPARPGGPSGTPAPTSAGAASQGAIAGQPGTAGQAGTAGQPAAGTAGQPAAGTAGAGPSTAPTTTPPTTPPPSPTPPASTEPPSPSATPSPTPPADPTPEPTPSDPSTPADTGGGGAADQPDGGVTPPADPAPEGSATSGSSAAP